MKKLTEYADHQFRFNTTETLYWMAHAAKHFKAGEASEAHNALLNALQYAHNLAIAQTRAEDCEEPNWEEMYLACLDSANERIVEGD